MLPANTFNLLRHNFIECMRVFNRWQKDATLIEKHGVVLAAGTTDFPFAYTNCMARVDRNTDPHKAIETGLEFFKGLNRSFTVFINGVYESDLDKAALERGLKMYEDSPWMILENRFNNVPSREDIRIKQVTDVSGLDTLHHIVRESYVSIGLPAEESDAIYAEPECILSPQTMHFIAYLNNAPVSTAMILFTRDTAGIYKVGTLPEARGHGVATHAMKIVSNICFDAGAKYIHLQASRMGRPIYEKIGYKAFDCWRLYCADISRI